MELIIDIDPKWISRKAWNIAKDWLTKKNDEFLKRILNEVGKPAAEGAFGSAVEVTVEKTSTGYALIGRGEAICFLEFGTGVYADSSDPFAQEMPFVVEPGSWSESELGAGTWGVWVNSGQPLENYPYNRYPKYGMWEAYKAITENVERIAKEVYR